jgi:hypothetical protein
MPLVIPFNTFTTQTNIYPAVAEAIKLAQLREKLSRMPNARITAFRPRRFGF